MASSLGYQKNKAMLVVVAKDGTILSTKYGAATASELDQVYAELDTQMK